MDFIKKNVAAVCMGILFLASSFGLVLSIASVNDMQEHITQLSTKVKQLEEGLVAVGKERDLLRGEVTSLTAKLETKTIEIAKVLPPAIPPIAAAPEKEEIKKPVIDAPTFGSTATQTETKVEAKPAVVAPVADKLEIVLLFDFDSYKIKPEYDEAIRKLAAHIKGQKNKVNIAIKGYADKIGDADYNVKLSRERADQVFFRLMNLTGAMVKKCSTQVWGLGHSKNTTDPLAGKRAVKITVTACK